MVKLDINLKTGVGHIARRYPLLCVSKRTGIVVMFTEDTTGVVLDPARTSYKQGAEISGFINCYDRDVWTILEPGESVTLTQE